ncbi:hypothetical protein ACET3Z_010325 [Daucus carota]
MLRVSKHEREELYTSRRRLADALKFLKSKGFQEDDIFKEMEHDGFSTQQPLRDDFGLPLFKNNGDNPFKDKMKAKMDEVNGSENTPKVSTDLPNTNLAGENKKCDGGNSNTTPKPSWSAVVKNSKLEEALTFDYCPMPPGASVVHNDQPSVQNDQPPAADTAAMPNTTVEHQANKPPSFELFVELTGESFAKGTSVAAPVPAATVDKLEEWTTVKGKKSSPPKTRSQLKKARKAVGRNSPQK